jgi:hypothetical protein
MLFMLAVPSGGSSIARTSQCETLTSAVFGTEEAWSWQRGEFVPYDGELSVRVRKRMAVRLFSGLLSRFDSDEKLVPFVMLA